MTDDLDGVARPQDGDYDGTPDFDLGAYEYNPATADTDGDLMPDRWEHRHGLDPTNAADAGWHADVDTVVNLHEWIADTDPNDAASYFRIEAINRAAAVRVWFESSSERNYTLEYTPSPTDTWNGVAGQVNVPGAGGMEDLQDGAGATSRLYRVQVGLPP